MSEMINFTIDGVQVTVPKGTTVYTAAKQLGIEIPIFCYLDRLPPFGACRMCLVEVEKMAKPQTSCTLQATEGMVVRTQSAMALNERKGILELLLINHPLDCPICDRGGECPLQEQALHDGPGKSRFFEDKRHFKKPLPLGPVLMLDRERCIVCARCTRFADLMAGDHALEFLERGYKTEVGTPDGGPAVSKFIGNTIMICPVGALTSQVYRFRARPWDNTPTESTCTLCPVGCSMILDSRDGEIMRTRSRENKDVNDIWLCDKGWFGYEFAYNSARLTTPLVRHNGKLEPASWDAALSLIASKIQEFKPKGKLAGLGGNPLTTEENYLFQQLMRQGAGVNHVDHRIGMSQNEEGISAGMEMSIGDCENLSFAILFGLDLTEEFPVIWLRLRQAINNGATVIFIGHYAPEIAKHLKQTIVHTPGLELNVLKEHLPQLALLAESDKKGALFVGRQYLETKQRKEILSQLTQFQQNKSNISLNILEGRGNSMGASLAGMRPDRGPLGERLQHSGLSALQVIEETAKNGWDFMYIAGADPSTKYPAKLWQQARSKLGFLVVQDLFLTETARQADVVLPTLSFIEKGGHFINIEGRVQQLLPGKEIPENIYSDGAIFMRLAKKLNVTLIIKAAFEEALHQTRIPLNRKPITGTQSIQANPALEGKLFATFAPALFDHGTRMKHNTHVLQLVKEPRVRMNPQEAANRGFKEGDKVKVSANENSVSALLQLDKQVALRTVVLPLGFPEVPVHNLGNELFNGLEVIVETV